jgi:hypothetical protein
MNEDYSSQAESTIPTDWSNQDSISSNDTHSILSPLPDNEDSPRAGSYLNDDFTSNSLRTALASQVSDKVEKSELYEDMPSLSFLQLQGITVGNFNMACNFQAFCVDYRLCSLLPTHTGSVLSRSTGWEMNPQPTKGLVDTVGGWKHGPAYSA